MVANAEVIRVQVKASDLADNGVSYVIGLHTPFSELYILYGRRVGVDPDDLYLTCRCQFLSPDSTSFVHVFNEIELILAYSKVLFQLLSFSYLLFCVYSF